MDEKNIVRYRIQLEPQSEGEIIDGREDMMRGIEEYNKKHKYSDQCSCHLCRMDRSVLEYFYRDKPE